MANYMEIQKPYQQPSGGELGPGEIVGADNNAIAAGFAVSNGATGPAAFVPAATTRIQFTSTTRIPSNPPAYQGANLICNNPPIYNVGEIGTFLSPISAALIAAGLAVSN
jgi:hypothetical protein